MLYALRKLIAFVFLGGIFWFLYRDLGHEWDDSYRFSVGVLVLAFAVVWLVVPPVVVYCRARARRARNRADYAAWKASVGAQGPQPLTGKGLKLDVAPGEHIYFVEKATLYADSDEGFGERLKPGRVGDVAFPSLGGKWFKAQRVRLWLTNRRLCFIGKELNLAINLTNPPNLPNSPNLPNLPNSPILDSFKIHAGGIVFLVRCAAGSRRFAFTLRNPLVTADVLASLRNDICRKVGVYSFRTAPVLRGERCNAQSSACREKEIGRRWEND